MHTEAAVGQACCLVQADRSGRAEEYADAYQESALFQENISLLSQGRGTESRVSITTIQVSCLPAHAFPKEGYSLPARLSLCLQSLQALAVFYNTATLAGCVALNVHLH